MRLRALFLVPAAMALAGVGGLALAQIEGGTRGAAPIDSSGDYEVSGVRVDVSAKNADAARLGGWRVAQRRAWQQLSQRLGGSGGLVSDGTLDSIVSGIVVENEQIGPNRYIAKLGVLFDRNRAGSLLGLAAYVDRSAAMLVIPVQWSGGAGTVFEQRTPWQEAWARFRTGNSAIDYVRPSGTGPDALLADVGQTGRRGRGWWRTVLNQYGASDVLIPTVRLFRQWPGGPVIAIFEARQGPDNRQLARFVLRVNNAAGLPALLDEGVRRIDEAYQTALRSGMLRPDIGLAYVPPEERPAEEALPEDTLATEATVLPGASVVTVQFDTPNATALANTEQALRGVPGVTSATTVSMALGGGVSLMRVGYNGSPEALRTALEARGWQVFGQGTTIRIRRAAQMAPPALPADNSTAG